MYQPKIRGKTSAGVIVVADNDIVKVGQGDIPGADCYRIMESGMLERTLQGAPIQMTSGGSIISDNSAVIAQPGDVVTFDYRVTDDESGQVKEIQPRQSITVPVDEPGTAPIALTGKRELDLAVVTLQNGGQIVDGPSGGKNIVNADGVVVLNQVQCDQAQKQATQGTPEDPNTISPAGQYVIDAFAAAGDPNVGGNPGAVAGSEG